MNKNDFIKNERQTSAFKAADGAIVYELFNPDNSAIKIMSVASGFLEAGKKARLHRHEESDEIYYVLSGQGQVQLGEKIFDVRPGDAICVPVNMVHGLINTSQEKPLKVLAVESPAYSDDDIFFLDQESAV